MKYFLIEISEGENAIKGKAIYEYPTLDAAVASFHKKLGTAMASELYESELVMVSDSCGAIYKNEYWQRETE